MAAHHFFLGLGAGAAMLTAPVLLFGSSVLNVPAQMDNWLNPPAAVQQAAVGDALRPQHGYIPGQSTPVPAPQAIPTLQPVQLPPPPQPTPTPVMATVPVAPPGQSLIRAGVIRSGGQPVPVRQAIGISSPTDPTLADGAPVLINTSGVIHVDNQDWRSVRGLNNVVGWVPASVVQLDGAPAPAPAPAQPAGVAVAVAGVAVTPTAVAAPAQATAAVAPTVTAAAASSSPDASASLVVANTDGQGVILRNSPRLDDRSARALFEGTPVSVMQRSGTDWVQVRAADGAQGWVPAQYLAPAHP